MTEKKPIQRINAELIYYQLAEIKSELADFKRHYVTKDESAALKAEIKELRHDIAEIKKTRSLIHWLYPTLSAAFGALFTYLIIEYFKIRH
jgi:ribosomal protein L29